MQNLSVSFIPPVKRTIRLAAALWLLATPWLTLAGWLAAPELRGAEPARDPALVLESPTSSATTPEVTVPTPSTPASSTLDPGYWLVRTYGLSDPGQTTAEVERLDVQRWRQSSWESATVKQLSEAASERPTVVYVHGNRGNDEEAVTRGRRIGQQLRERVGDQPFQVLIWSWPSGQTRRGRRDFVDKAERADTEAWYLSALLREFAPRAEVGFIGYSYGARIVTGALHWTAGGGFEGRTLPTRAEPATRYRVALLAPALHTHWLADDGCHGEALDVTQRMLLFYNPCDPALRWYKFLYRRERPQALGQFGISSSWLGSSGERVDQWDVSPIIGRTHDEDAYLDSPWISDQLRSTLFPPSSADPSPPSDLLETQAALDQTDD